MARTGRVETKVYAARKNRCHALSYAMLFISCILLISGLMGTGNPPTDLTVIPAVTPSPTKTAGAFDETPDEREITLAVQPWYAIQLGIYENEKSARELAESYKTRGAAGYLWQDGERYRVLAAVYDQEEDARSVRSQLKEYQHIDSYVFDIASVELVLRMKGTKGQLDSLEACFKSLESLPETLQQISVALDRQEMNEEEIKRTLSNESSKVSELRMLLQERFLKPYHQVVSSLAETLSLWEQKLAALIDYQGSATALAGLIKAETLAFIQSVHIYYQGIAQ